jgi:exosortase
MDSSPTTSEPPRPGLVEELKHCWRDWPDKPLFFGLLVAWLALFHFLGNSTFGYVDTPSLFVWMYNAYNAPLSEDGHGNLIPLVVLVLFWMKREELRGLPRRPSWAGVTLIMTALILHLLGFAAQQPRLSIVALFTGIYGIIGALWGWSWLRASFFPLILFAFCVPLGSLSESITFPLRMVVTKISVGLSQNVLGIDVVREGSQIFDTQRSYSYDVAPACSGIRSLISLLALTTIYGFLTFRTTWRRILMIALAFPLAIAGNVIRITAVIVAAEAFGQNAGAKVHDGAGFITFAVAIVCVMLISYGLRENKGVSRLTTAEKPV